jgi:hypothetical protein
MDAALFWQNKVALKFLGRQRDAGKADCKQQLKKAARAS